MIQPYLKSDKAGGQYYVYANGNQRWYRCNGGANLAEWYLYTVDDAGQQIGDGEYVDFNPARGTS